MQPGWFSTVALVLLTVACQPVTGAVKSVGGNASSVFTVVSQHEYTVEQQLVLTNAGPGEPQKQNLWVALIRDFPTYQQVKSVVVSPADYTLVVDEYGNHIAEFDLSDHPPGTTKIVSIRTDVLVNELTYDLSKCIGDLPTEFTQAELYIESANPQILQLAQSLSAQSETTCAKVRAFYDYVANELTYTYNGRSWGAQAALGPMGADCTEYSSLLIALSRAQGIPARYFEGLHYLKTGTEGGARLEHAWPDVYLPGTGWVALDPTLGRLPSTRATYFAHYTPDHIIVTMGRNPSTLRGSSYWTHLYWPGNSTTITVEAKDWKIDLVR
jgi:transglutaminase-like putative cysteine protease